MEIIIGATPPLGASDDKPKLLEKDVIEAQVLNVRPPRRGIAGPSGAERRGKNTRDPIKARILTLMVVDGDLLPKDLDKAKYRVNLRFQRM